MKRRKLQKTANPSSSSQSSVSTTSFTLRRRPAGSSRGWEQIWRKEVDRSREDGRITETRETYLDEPCVRNFRERIGSIFRTTNNPAFYHGLIEYEEGGSDSTEEEEEEIREENLETTEPTETLLGEENSQPQPASKENYPSLFTIGLSLLILGIFGLSLLCFANWTNKNQVYKFQRNIRQNHYSKTATK